MHARRSMAKPVGEVARSATILVRVTPDERERYHRAAKRDDMTLSDWFRTMADARAEKSATKRAKR